MCVRCCAFEAFVFFSRVSISFSFASSLHAALGFPIQILGDSITNSIVFVQNTDKSIQILFV